MGGETIRRARGGDWSVILTPNLAVPRHWFGELAGFMNPDYFLFDHQALERGEPATVVYELPYADTTHLPTQRLEAWMADGNALEFGHSLDAQIGGQIAAGFVIAGFYEDRWDAAATPLDRFMPTSMATLALRQEPR